MDEELLKYPIGKFSPLAIYSDKDRENYTKALGLIVPSLREVLICFDTDQMQTPYRTGGWTVQQVIHHMADNDMNAYIRLKRALTEDEPIASSYRQELWAQLNDYVETPIEVSIQLMEAIHFRMINLLNGLNSENYNRRFSTHVLGLITVDVAIQRFIWHNNHHISQIETLAKRKGWWRIHSES